MPQLISGRTGRQSLAALIHKMSELGLARFLEQEAA
jgi:hypothetical protein